MLLLQNSNRIFYQYTVQGKIRELYNFHKNFYYERRGIPKVHFIYDLINNVFDRVRNSTLAIKKEIKRQIIKELKDDEHYSNKCQRIQIKMEVKDNKLIYKFFRHSGFQWTYSPGYLRALSNELKGITIEEIIIESPDKLNSEIVNVYHQGETH